MQEIPSGHRPGSRPPSFRAGLHATLSPAIRQIGAGSCASRISNLRSALNTRATTASGGRRHRSASSAAARMAICRTSTGAASFTRIFAGEAKAAPPVLAGSRCGRKMRARARIRAISASPATAAHRCRWRSCFSPAVSALAPASVRGSATAIQRHAMHPTGLRLLTRSATNTYFPQVARVLSLPQTVDELARRIETFWSVLERCTSLDDVRAARRFNPALRASLEEYSDEVVFNRLQSMHGGGAQVDAAEDPRIAEFQLLASGAPLIGADRTRRTSACGDTRPDNMGSRRRPVARGIKSLVAVHRLREVACLYGFTRFEPAPLATDELEDVGLAVSGAPLGQMPDWLPAVEQFGEGFFLQFAPEALAPGCHSPVLLSARDSCKPEQLPGSTRSAPAAKR